MSVDYCFKIILVGEANSGKTTLVNLFCDNSYRNYYDPTIGVEFISTTINESEKNIKLQFWDTAGQQIFAPIIKNYYKNIAGMFYVIDLTNRTSIRKIDYWLNEYRKNKSENYPAYIVVIGNKCESSKRVISEKEITEIFKDKKIFYIETSALDNINIDKAKNAMIKGIINNLDLDSHLGIVNNNVIQLNNKQINNSERNCCCLQ